MAVACVDRVLEADQPRYLSLTLARKIVAYIKED